MQTYLSAMQAGFIRDFADGMPQMPMAPTLAGGTGQSSNLIADQFSGNAQQNNTDILTQAMNKGQEQTRTLEGALGLNAGGNGAMPGNAQTMQDKLKVNVTPDIKTAGGVKNA